MSHKYAVGDCVQYRPPGGKSGQFKILRRMPTEFQSYDWKYLIRGAEENFDRNVLECQLRPSTE